MATEKEQAEQNPELGRRFAEPFGSQAWRADGTPFTRADYIRAGMTPPTKAQIAEWERREREGL